MNYDDFLLANPQTSPKMGHNKWNRMKSIYKSLKEFDPNDDTNACIVKRDVEKLFTEGTEITFIDSSEAAEVKVINDCITLSKTSNGIKSEYAFARDLTLVQQSISMTAEQKTLDFLYSESSNCWHNIILEYKDVVHTAFYTLSENGNDPDDFVFYQNGATEEKEPLAFNRKIYRWASGHESYENSYLVSEIMQHSRGIIREDMSTEIVCEMFQITKEQLAEIPALLMTKSKQSPQMK